MSAVRCLNCKKSTKGFKLFCGNCGAPIETSLSPLGEQSSENSKSKNLFLRRTPLIVAISVILVATTGIIFSFVLGQKEFTVSAKVLLPKESSLWLDEPFKVQGLVQSSTEMPNGFSYEILDKTGKKIKIGSITQGTKSFRFSATITRMIDSAQYTVRILNESGKIEFSTKSPLVHAVTTSLPSSCNLPTLESHYGKFDETRQDTDWSGVYEMGTFYCRGYSFIEMWPMVDYWDQTYYEPKRNRYEDWLGEVENQLSSSSYNYIQTTLSNYPVLYDCYETNPGGPKVIDALINVHGVKIEYFNEGCLEANTKYILEAVDNVPVQNLK